MIVAVPFFFAVILPFAFTVATFLLLDLYATFLEIFPVAVTFVFKVKDFPFFKVNCFAGRFVTAMVLILPPAA